MTTSKSPNIDNNTGSGLGFVLGVLAVLVIGIALLAYVVMSREAVPSGEAEAPIEVTGDPLVSLRDSGVSKDSAQDPAVGTQAPGFIGTDFSDKQVEIKDDGRAKVVYFLAHWCQHCAKELPMLVDLIEAGELPQTVDLYAISTSYKPERGNPPSRWFYDEGWTMPILRDDADNSALIHAGGNGFPFAIYIDAENNIMARSSGETDPATTVALWQELAQTAASK